ncbi:MAG TPA: GNAT family N-acetyltransferase [Puia sp.]|nr:GNAT family N-acetyltransferase [Puia sp.]
MNIQHTHTEKGGRFFVGNPAAPTALMVYRMAGDHKMIIDHTEVSEIHKGEGIGRQLVAEAVAFARQHDMKIQPICSFTRSILKSSDEYKDVYMPPSTSPSS